MASFGLLFASVILAVWLHFAMLCFPCVLSLDASLVPLGSSSARTGENLKSSESQCSMVWSYQKMVS